MAKEKLALFFQNSGFMSPEQATAIASIFHPRVIGNQEFVLRAGKVSDEYLFLERGLMRAYVHDSLGNDVTTAFYAGGRVVMEAASFFNRAPSQENIQALTDCEGWTISFQQLNALFHNRPEFREFGRAMLVRALVTLKARMLEQAMEPAAVRYQKLIRNSPQIFQHAPLKHVASYLGVTKSSLSRIRAAAAELDSL